MLHLNSDDLDFFDYTKVTNSNRSQHSKACKPPNANLSHCSISPDKLAAMQLDLELDLTKDSIGEEFTNMIKKKQTMTPL